jgi:hypothetical protein
MFGSVGEKHGNETVREFNRHFGNITCRGLIGMDFSKPGEYQKFLNSGVWRDKCEKYVEFIIERLYEIEDQQHLFVQVNSGHNVP